MMTKDTIQIQKQTNNINTKKNNTIETNKTTQETKYLINNPSVRDKGLMVISSIRLALMRQSWGAAVVVIVW